MNWFMLNSETKTFRIYRISWESIYHSKLKLQNFECISNPSWDRMKYNSLPQNIYTTLRESYTSCGRRESSSKAIYIRLLWWKNIIFTTVFWLYICPKDELSLNRQENVLHSWSVIWNVVALAFSNLWMSDIGLLYLIFSFMFLYFSDINIPLIHNRFDRLWILFN